MELSNFIVDENISVYDAADVINKNTGQIAFICREGKLVAAVSDGDIRRYILKNGDFSKPVSEIANYKPFCLPASKRHEAKALMLKKDFKAVPIVNKREEIIAIEFINQKKVLKKANLNTPVVIMAGGKGTRLAPYTDVLPKPLIPINNKTITEHIIDRFMEAGCNDFYIIVNYKKELIKAYFNEISLPCRVEFIDEAQFQGTGGGLKLLEGKIKGDFFMSNCDVLIESDYGDILNHHKESNNIVTMVCAMKKIQVPYGTVILDDDGKPEQFVERPEYQFLTNTGLYAISEPFLNTIPKDEFIHITQLIQSHIDKGDNVGTYPISESAWLDMGQIDEMTRMRGMIGL